jgi:hypothetical protein
MIGLRTERNRALSIAISARPWGPEERGASKLPQFFDNQMTDVGEAALCPQEKP